MHINNVLNKKKKEKRKKGAKDKKKKFITPSFDCNSNEMQTAAAFTVINRDNFQTTLPILHINQMYDDYPEKNIIRHRENKNIGSYSKKRINRSSDHFILASLQNNQINPLKKKEYSKSHDNIGLGVKKIDQSLKSVMSLSTENFTDVLNEKLEKVEQQELNRRIMGMKDREERRNLKKPFITTVKSGEFLMPPPEVAALLGISPIDGAWIGNETFDYSGHNHHHHHDDILRPKFRPLMSLGRRPEVRHNKHNARCQAALKATVDFTMKFVNSTTDTTSTTLANSQQTKRLCNNVENRLPQMQRKIPYKKLQPIEGIVVPTIMISPGDHHHQKQKLPFGNIMFDRRVARGSTFAVPMLLEGEHSQEKRKYLAKKRSQQQASRSMMLRIKSPPPIPGRKHEPIQTEMYLEELYKRPDESEIGTQTDYFLERPMTPLYFHAKTGLDAETQISPGDLFDYDVEVQPILDVLVGKTIEQALIEVLEEEEQSALREQQRRFEELRAAEKAEQQRLEEEERRLREEKDRRVKQHEEAMNEQQDTEERVAVAVLLTGYIAELLPAVLEDLKISGFLLDEIRGSIDDDFMPWILNEVKKETSTVMESRELLMEIIKEIIENRAKIYKKLGEEYDSSRELAVPRRLMDSDGSSEIEESGGKKDIDYEHYQSPNAIQ